MRLVDLNPVFLDTGGPGHFFTATGLPMPLREAVGVDLDCPCGCDDRLYVPFKNPISPGCDFDGWERTGETFETLTLKPSIQRMDPNVCHWHGYITDGETRTV